ncbi:retrovirus-related pol polyprotein from transposon TNT 1-94 [Tanacetum coccineum]
MQVNVQFLQQKLQTQKGQRFVTIVKQSEKIDTVSYHKLFDILKQFQLEVNDIRAERIAKSANPLALIAALKNHRFNNYHKQPKPQRSKATTSDKRKMQKNLPLLAKYFKSSNKPTNNNHRKLLQTQRTRLEIPTPRSGSANRLVYSALNCKGKWHYAKECRKPKRKDYAYHKEKMMIVQTKLNKGMEAHYSYMQKIQEVSPEEVQFNCSHCTVLDQKHDDLVKNSLLTKSQLEGYLKENTKDISDLQSVSKDVTCSYLHSLSDLNAYAELQCLYLHKVKECECLAQKLSKQTESVNNEVHNKLLKSFAKLEKHSISLELSLQHCKEQMKNNPVCKENASNVFRKEREQYHEIQDLKAQMQDKNMVINELKKLILVTKGKSVETQFDKPSVVRQPNAQRIPKPSVLGKPTPFSNSPEMRSFQTKQSVNKTNVSDGLFKPVTQQNLPQNRNQAIRNTNVLKPGMFRIASTTTQNRTPQLPHASRNTNPHMSKSSGVIHTTSVSRPQLKSYQVKDKVVPNISQVKFTKKEVEDHHRISSISKKTKSVTACNDSSNSRTSNVNAVCAECGKCVFNSNHDACVSRYLKYVNARTKKPNVVPISASKPKRKANKSVATPHKKTIVQLSPIPLIDSDHKAHDGQNKKSFVFGGLVPQGHKALDYTTLTPVPQDKMVVPSAENSFSSQQDIVNRRTLRMQWPDSALDRSKSKITTTFDRLKVWELVDKPFGKMIIKLKWLWKNKKDEDQTVIRNKARLVAKGYAQEEGIDFEDRCSSLLGLEAVSDFCCPQKQSHKSFPSIRWT